MVKNRIGLHLFILLFLLLENVFSPALSKALSYQRSSFRTNSSTEFYFRRLGPRSSIRVITTSPGEELYTTFGHAAIRILDPDQSLDIVYGYGEFNFDTPNFYPEFVRGTLNYTISADPFELFKSSFLDEPYEMFEQTLRLDSIEKNNIYQLLLINTLPKNRLYRYDFFFNNCSTRIRDAIIHGNQLKDIFSRSSSKGSPSFRDLLKTYLLDRPWIRLGTDLILGLPADKKLSPFEETFLPFYLREYLASAKKKDGLPLVYNSSYLLKAKTIKDINFSFTPILFFWLMALLTMFSFLNQRIALVFSNLIFILFGLLGLLILYLWLGTERSSYGLNLNILWASPLLLPLPFLKNNKKLPLIGLLLIQFFALFVCFILKLQVFNAAVLPICLIILAYLINNLLKELSNKALWLFKKS